MTTGTNSFAGIGCTSDARKVGIGCSKVGFCLNMFVEVVARLRSLARIQPFCTNVSLPSGRTSLTVAWRSTSGVEDRSHRCTAPAPITVVLVLSGADRYATAVPAGFCFQFHCHADALAHRPPVPVFCE